ncbi:SAM-dependent methyltransferase [Flavobacterium sp. W4I14]|nr:SAM-dependent methyltransferase [Flavobacterium sp. W4I14]
MSQAVNNFEEYSQYYNLLYKDKNYGVEVDYVIDLIKQYNQGGQHILELGSGTGIHANLFAKKGYNVLGLERSVNMVEIASQKKSKNVQFQIADITHFEVEKKFDIALSLFHVISYLTNNKQLISTFKNVFKSLNPGGLFIFDVWHSPAVYHQKPEKRTKTLKNNTIEVIRYANPIVFSEQNTIEVNYEINVREISTNKTSIIQEKHPMRHFSQPEIELLSFTTGFEVLNSEEFLTKNSPSVDTWGVCYILKKL